MWALQQGTALGPLIRNGKIAQFYFDEFRPENHVSEDAEHDESVNFPRNGREIVKESWLDIHR